jgi:hypothetical protein
MSATQRTLPAYDDAAKGEGALGCPPTSAGPPRPPKCSDCGVEITSKNCRPGRSVPTSLRRRHVCYPCTKKKETWKLRRELYGVTRAEWEAIFEGQGQKCGVCGAKTSGQKRGWATDHDPVTGRVRGILCLQCNTALGVIEGPRYAMFLSYLAQFEPGQLRDAKTGLPETKAP